MCIGLCGCWCVVSCWGSSELSCVVVGVWHCGGIHPNSVVVLLVCGIVLGVKCIGLCGCWCLVLWWRSFELCCVVVGVWYCDGSCL